jgi:hypothetical protein
MGAEKKEENLAVAPAFSGLLPMVATSSAKA